MNVTLIIKECSSACRYLSIVMSPFATLMALLMEAVLNSVRLLEIQMQAPQIEVSGVKSNI